MSAWQSSGGPQTRIKHWFRGKITQPPRPRLYVPWQDVGREIRVTWVLKERTKGCFTLQVMPKHLTASLLSQLPWDLKLILTLRKPKDVMLGQKRSLIYFDISWDRISKHCITFISISSSLESRNWDKNVHDECHFNLLCNKRH